jgi:hypothetical protein
MKWLLVFLAFEMQPDGSMQGRMQGTKAFETKEACNVEGADFRKIYPQIPEKWDTMTVCISEDAFNSGLMVNGASVKEEVLDAGRGQSSQK